MTDTIRSNQPSAQDPSESCDSPSLVRVFHVSNGRKRSTHFCWSDGSSTVEECVECGSLPDPADEEMYGLCGNDQIPDYIDGPCNGPCDDGDLYCRFDDDEEVEDKEVEDDRYRCCSPGLSPRPDDLYQ